VTRRQPTSNRRPYADQQALAWTFTVAFVAAFAFGLYVGYLVGASR